MRFWQMRDTVRSSKHLHNNEGYAGGLMVCRGLGDVEHQTYGQSIQPDIFDFSGEDLAYMLITSDGIWDKN